MGVLLPFTGESELVIMIGLATEETNGSDRVPDLKRLRCEPMVGTALLLLERNGALLRAHAEVWSKALDTADIVRDEILHQVERP